MRVFFSYNSKHKDLVEKACDIISDKGHDVFMDAYELEASDDWMLKIEKEINDSNAALIFVTDLGIGSWQSKEVLKLINDFDNNKNYKLIPIVSALNNKQVSFSLPWYLADKQWLEFKDISDPTDFAYEKLWGKLNEIETIPQEQIIEHKNPYKGLLSYEVEDEAFFYGRQNDLNRVFHNKLRLHVSIKEYNFLAIVANSGCGKSSFVKAGILAALKKGQFKGSKKWNQLQMKPGIDPLGELSASLKIAGLLNDSRQFEKDVKQYDDALLRVFREQEQMWVLYIDQFEEAITQCKDEVLRRCFLLNIAQAVKTEKLLVLLSMRSDYYAQFASYMEFKALLESNNYTLPGIEIENQEGESNKYLLREIIRMPAHKAGMEVTQELTNQLISELREVKGALPVVQLAMSKLWFEKVNKNYIDINDYARLSNSKGLSGIIEEHIEKVFLDITKGNKRKEELVRQIFILFLVEVTSGAGDVRKTANRKDICLNGYSINEIESIINELCSERSRILKVYKDGEQDQVDVVHEVIIREWSRLKKWINEKREALKTRDRILQDIALYNEKKEDLYLGAELRRANLWKKQHADLVDETINKFLNQSQRGKNRILAGAFSTMLLFALIAFYSFIIYLPERNFENNKKISNQLEAVGFNVDSLSSLKISDEKSREVTETYFKYYPKYNKIDTLIIDAEISSSFLNSFQKIPIKHLSISRSDNLTELSGIENLKSLTSLIIKNHSNFIKLSGIENLKSLTSLALSDNYNLKNLSGIENLKSLTSLTLSNNDSLINLSGIENLKSLTSLTLNDNRNLKTLSGIKNLRSLTSLTLSFNTSLDSLSGIENLKSLTSLALSDNYNLKNLSDIENLKSLTSLTLSSNKNLDSLSGIENLKSLTSLTLSYYDSLKNLSGIENLKSLTSLTLSSNKNLASLSDIENLKSLTSLTLSNNYDLTDLSVMESLKSLSSLTIDYNHYLKNLLGFKNLKSLTSLTLSNNDSLKNLSGIENLKSLTSLTLSNNDSLKNLSGIENLKSLTSLTLSSNKNLASLSGIENLKSLTSLTLSNNDSLKNLSGIENLKSLTSLSLSNNDNLTNLSGFESLDELQILYFYSRDKKFLKLIHLERLPQLKKLYTNCDIDYKLLSKNHKGIKLIKRE